MHAWWFLFVLLWGAASALAQEVSPLLVKRANSGQTRLASSLLAVRELVAREGMATLRALSLPGLRRATADTLEVYLHVTALTPATLAALHREGVQVYRTSSRFGLVYAAVPWAALEAVAALPFVRWLRLPVYAVRRTGSVTSRGDEVMGVQALRAQLGVDGSGVRVGIISDSLTRFQEAVASGDLPADLLVLEPGDPRDSNEGRAMAEIVHDLAPGATLLFHSGFPTSLDMIAAVEALVAAGADIIVDDVGFLDEPVFEDGPVAQAVQQAVAQGVLYVTAAGNSADRHYQGPYQEFNPHDGDPEVNLHDFGGGDPTLAVDPRRGRLAGGGAPVAQPL
ncbi:MAG: hypothetical protein KatS3mg131_2587 [Candidatus Tectimicrobiota bacterium]|nr:MAG: hypothetical protein KatS3mg131_2587 [Candidatus Tectomicrobia bacterium]